VGARRLTEVEALLYRESEEINRRPVQHESMETIAIDTESRSTTSTHNMSTKPINTYTYIIAGGGLAGSTLASLLSTTHPSAKILVIEAGPDVSKHPLTSSPLACFGAHNSPLDWAYTTVPKPTSTTGSATTQRPRRSAARQ
jgi:hypothetical protein